MALEMNDMLMRLSPMPSSGGAPDDKRMQLAQLKLLREKFEEEKRKNAEDERYRQLAEAGEMRRAELMIQKQREQDAAAAAAKTLEERRGAHADMFKYEDAGDVEGMNNAANRLNAAGGLAEMTGEDANGMPTWRVELDAEEARKRDAAQEAQAAPGPTAPPGEDESLSRSLSRMGALGYGKLGTRGTLDEGPGVASSADLTPEQLARVTGGGVQERAAGAEEPGALDTMGPPAPGDDTSPIKPEYQGAAQALDPLGSLRPQTLAPVKPAQPDLTGGIPKNVIDTGAMAAHTQQRLGPVMANIEASMPAAYRGSTQHNDAAAAALGLPIGKAVEQSLALRVPAEAAIGRERALESDETKSALAQAPKPLTRVQIEELATSGSKKAKEFYDDGIDEAPSRVAAAQRMIEILGDDDPRNDNAIAFELPNMLGSKGAQSNKDLAVALGLDALSTIDQVKDRITNIVLGGFGEERKKSLAKIIQQKIETDNESVFKYLDATSEAARITPDPDVRRGIEEYIVKVPPEYRDAWHKDREAHPPPEAAQGGMRATPVSTSGGSRDDGGEGMGEIQIPETSGISFRHNNPGNLVFADQEGAEKGEPKAKGGNWARFKTVDDGLNALRAQIERDSGMTLRAFITKYAPPTDGNDTEKYIADAVAELKAEADDKVSDIDTYDLMRLIVRKESSTVMPYQYAAVDEKNRKLDAKAGEPAASGKTGADDAELHSLME